jgi:hypothetical protein
VKKQKLTPRPGRQRDDTAVKIFGSLAGFSVAVSYHPDTDEPPSKRKKLFVSGFYESPGSKI